MLGGTPMSDAPTAAESAERTREAERHLAEADELLRDQLEALDIAGKALVDAARSEAERIAALEDEVDHRTPAERERDIIRSRKRTAILADARHKADRARRGRITDKHGVIDP